MIRPANIFIAIAAALLLTTHALAQPTTVPADQSLIRSAQTPGAASDTINTLSPGRIGWSLAIVIGLILALRFLAKKFLPGAGAHRGSTAMQVLLRTPISPRQQLLIIQAGRRLIVVGDSGQQLNTLCEISDPQEISEMLAQINAEQATSLPKHFKKIFAPRIPVPQTESEPPDPELATTRAELNGLLSKVQTMSRQFRPNS